MDKSKKGLILLLVAVLSFNCNTNELVRALDDIDPDITIAATIDNEDSSPVALDKAALEITYAYGDNVSSVKQNIGCPDVGENGSSITWVSSDPVRISDGGVVNRPDYATGDRSVTLTATISNSPDSDTKLFTLNVKAPAVKPEPKIGCTQMSTGFQESYGLCNNIIVSIGINNFYQQNLPTFAAPQFVSAGGNNGFVIDSTGTVGWGRDDANQITNIPNKTLTSKIDGGMWKMACSEDNNSGYIDCWGDQSVQPFWNDVLDFDVGWSTVCAITGVVGVTTIKCVGLNITIPAISNPTMVAVGRDHICAINATTIVCSGSNTHNQLNIPTGIINPSTIESGDLHTVVIAENGIFAWGRNNEGQLLVPNVLGITKIDASHKSTWYTDNKGVAYCRGDNSWSHCPDIYDTTK